MTKTEPEIAAPAETVTANEPRSRVLKNVLLSVAGLSVVIGLVVFWLHSQNFESTDDAQIEGHLDNVNSRITGTVVYINPNVENDHFVAAGSLLLKLDPRDYEAELQRAQATLETKEAEARSARVNVPIIDAGAFAQLRAAQAAKGQALAAVQAGRSNLEAAQHKLQQDQAIHQQAERDRARYQALVDKHEISRSDYDARDTASVTSAQLVSSDQALVASEQQKIAEANDLVVQREAQIDLARTAPHQVVDARARSDSSIGQLNQAKANLRTAQLNLSYTELYAPVGGVVGRKTVELGHRVQPGQGLLIIVPLDDIWVTANFKESQLGKLRPGQSVQIHVDAFGRKYQGTVEALPGAAGPLFSLFPPENASGNYVKVVQRFPVRLRFNKDQDPDHLFRPGMSVEPTVTVR